ncbi:MAG: hypothetical protein JNG90_03300 [Planctomycetaceae bacterium]|nr:hypothetical protein [Planctomycetaceae bacterium]
MSRASRREFLAQVGQGVVIATVGYGTAVDMGLASGGLRRVLAADAPQRLHFGAREALVALLQETPAESTIGMLAAQLRAGVTLDELVAAAALANARTFGGEDYVGFHTFMALAPAWQMSRQLPAAQAALPVAKVLYRNAKRMQEHGGANQEILHAIAATSAATGPSGEALRDAVHNKDIARAEQLLAAAAAQSPEEAYNELLPLVAEAVEVHRTVLAYRAWDLLDLVGREHATTLLRQSLHYSCSNDDKYGGRFAGIPGLLAQLLDEYKLVGRAPGTRHADDDWVERTSEALLQSSPEQGADLVAAALADGMSRDSVADAISLAANQLVLRDPGRTGRQIQPNKPEGSVHGDSVGVHACDSINAWRNIAAVSDERNSVVSLILAGWQAANDGKHRGSDVPLTEPRPHLAELEQVQSREPAPLLAELDDAIRQQDQARACAVVHRYGQQNHASEPVAELLLKYAISEDGALHAEKYYRTATEEFSRSRPKFRWRQLVALARVTASEYGQPAPGMDEARRVWAG